MDKKKRYFMITFSGLSKDNNLRTGKIEYSTNDGKHANEIIAIAVIEKQFDLSQVFVKGIWEMEEQDFMDWIEGREDNPLNFPENTNGVGGFL
jgi:hypothetical protein